MLRCSDVAFEVPKGPNRTPILSKKTRWAICGRRGARPSEKTTPPYADRQSIASCMSALAWAGRSSL